MVKAKAYIFEKQFVGVPKVGDLKLVEEDLPELKDGEVLTEAVYLSVDPYMRAYAPRLRLGTTFIGSQVAKIIESKNPKYSVGQHVVGAFGWRTHTISEGKDFWLIPDPEGLPLSLSLGVLGMPGNTAYFGFLELCEPKAGETVIVTGAAGAVGSLVGQIAKIKGLKVIGVAGSDDKGKWLVDELKFDNFINYKDKDFEKKLIAAAPNGIDCFFDNVGSEQSSIIINNMNALGRISVCGAIAGYNNPESLKVTPIQEALVAKQLKIEGFLVDRWKARWFEGIKQSKDWIKEGKLQYRETVTEGFENMFQAFIEMLNGKNYGKAVVKV